MHSEVVIKSVPTYMVASLREIIPAYNQEGILWQKLGMFIEKQGIQCKSPSFAIYHDMEYREADVDAEVVMAVDELQEDKEGIRFRETEVVPCAASMMVNGPFENIGSAYNALAEWAEKNGYDVAGPSRQVCHKGPWNENSPENYLTELQIPVAKK